MYREKLDNIQSSKSLLATLDVTKKRRIVKLSADRSERHKENAAEGRSYKAGKFEIIE